MRKTASLHEAIKAGQADAALEYSECKPSEVTEVYWLYAIRRVGSYPAATDRSGKWLVFVHVSHIDAMWAKIKKATEQTKPGGSSKVATAIPNSNAIEPDKKVICVYTYDWTDGEDARRVREELRQLGVTWKIAYKADEDTLDGKYRVTGHTRISRYYE